MENRCLHCQEPSSENSFCCFGCQTAYHLIRGAGLEAVYRLPNRHWRPPSHSAPFEAFDHPDFLNHRAPLLDGIREADFYIEGLMCVACVWIVERLNRFHASVLESRVDFGRSVVRLKWKDSPKALSEILTILSKLGYEASASEVDLRASQISKIEWIRLGVSGASAAAAMHIGLNLISAHSSSMDAFDARMLGLFAAVASLPAVTFGAIPFFRNTWQALKLRKISADLLISLAVVLGYGTSLRQALEGKIESYFDAISMIVFLLLIGRILIRLATTNALRRPVWFARTKGQLLPADSLLPAATVEIFENEIVPVDGRLLTPEAWLDQSSLTGESLPVRFVSGQKILQGAISKSRFELESIHSAKKSYLETLVRKVQSNEWVLPSQTYESVFSVAILLLALLTLAVDQESGFTKCLAILIVTCPCALQLSRPLTLVAFKRQSQLRGVSILKLDRVLNWIRVKRIFFDKTGTLTLGSPELVREVQIKASNFSTSELNAFVYALSAVSSHPLSRSLALKFSNRPQASIEIEPPQEIAGVGVRGVYKNTPIEISQSLSETSGSMTTSLKINHEEVIRFEFQDLARPHIREVLEELSGAGFQIHLASGDRASEVQRFSKEIGPLNIETHAELKPHDKSLLQNSTTCFIGDGLNDAEAMMAAATSVGFSGSAEANLQSADVYLLKRDLRVIPELIGAVRRANQMIRLNLTLSMLYNLVCILLVYAGFVGPILCAIFMPLSSLTVILLSSYRKYYTPSQSG